MSLTPEHREILMGCLRRHVAAPGGLDKEIIEAILGRSIMGAASGVNTFFVYFTNGGYAEFPEEDTND
jgi:truncated hemoglobin YjbI